MFESKGSDGQQSYSETNVLEYHRSLPSSVFDVALPEDVTTLDERVQNVIRSDEDQGHRLSVFECSRDGTGGLLIGLTCREIGRESIHIDSAKITDVATGVELASTYDRHRSSWSSGTSERVELWCLTPKSPPAPLAERIRIDVSAGVFESYETKTSRGSRRVREARLSFAQLPVTEGLWPKFPERKSPPWYPIRWSETRTVSYAESTSE